MLAITNIPEPQLRCTFRPIVASKPPSKALVLPFDALVPIKHRPRALIVQEDGGAGVLVAAWAVDLGVRVVTASRERPGVKAFAMMRSAAATSTHLRGVPFMEQATASAASVTALLPMSGEQVQAPEVASLFVVPGHEGVGDWVQEDGGRFFP